MLLKQATSDPLTLTNFGRLVRGGIEADVCKQTFILKHFSQSGSTSAASFYTALTVEIQQNASYVFLRCSEMFALLCQIGLLSPIFMKMYRNVTKL